MCTSSYIVWVSFFLFVGVSISFYFVKWLGKLVLLWRCCFVCKHLIAPCHFLYMGVSFFITLLCPQVLNCLCSHFRLPSITLAKLSPSRTYAGTKPAFPAQKIPWPLVAKIWFGAGTFQILLVANKSGVLFHAYQPCSVQHCPLELFLQTHCTSSP